jgi:HEAT repeat protein
MGKTTSLRHLAWEVARHALAKSPAGSEPAGDSPEISIYVELKYYKGAAELETLLARRVDDVLKRRQLTLGYDEAERTRVMRAWLADQNARFLLLLDGLNEVAPEQRGNARKVLEGFLSYPHRLLISCREQDYDESLHQHAAFVLQGLQEDEILGYLRTHLSDKGKALFDAQIRRDEKMRTLVANPLMLWLVGEVARANPEARLPANRGQLFRVFMETMPGLRRKENVPLPDVPEDVVEAALRALAFAMQEHGPPPPNLGRVRSWALPTATYRLEEVLAVGKAWRFLKSDGCWGEPVEFLHRLFQEYFAADELRARLERRRDYAAVLGNRPLTGKWDEVIVMLSGIHDDPTGLVQWLAAEAVARRHGRAALLAHRCWETSDATGDGGMRAAVVDALIRTLGDADAWVRLGVARALGIIGDVRAVEPLIQALDDPEGFVCLGATWALGSIGDVRAVEPLIWALGDPDAWVRFGAIWALERIGDVRAVEPLIQFLSDQDEEIRSLAAWPLGKIGDVQAVGPLIQALGDPDAMVRRETAEALGKIGDPRALPVLERVAREDTGVLEWRSKLLPPYKHERVADVAREAAEKIRGRMSSGSAAD